MEKENELNIPKEKLSLGLIKIPDKTFEHDNTVSERYRAFASELLRLSLLGMAAIGFIVTNVFLKPSSQSGNPASHSERPFPIQFKYLVSLSLVCLALSAGAALCHGYVSAATLARHLMSIRRELRQAVCDAERAEQEKKERNSRLSWEIRLNFASAAFLWLGALLLGISFIVIL